ncbi:Uncharacterized protein BM_BM9607 [Brugia malayi]|uniref:Bm9607 n=2 Tax=Brugia malayi TaxID=6279 RepID=A0A0K0JZV8_BRUMA|nr:Uncharacterized protein BM_BM9607 [Brugia malayi]CDP94548.1 Bm9607 [Brugia malayi]VIO86726.1 Uncharacterized protein BM_BM9607 [Brugia malayi]
MADNESSKCDDECEVQHLIRFDQSKIHNTTEETVKSTPSDHQERSNSPLEGTKRNRCRFSISDILSDKHSTSRTNTRVAPKADITTPTTGKEIVSISLPAVTNINDEASPYINSQLPRYLHAGVLQQSAHNSWLQPWLSTIRSSIAQEQNLVHSNDKRQVERVHGIIRREPEHISCHVSTERNRSVLHKGHGNSTHSDNFWVDFITT